MGIRPGMWRPIDLSYLAPDTEGTLPIYLVVYLSGNGLPLRARDLHWAITWSVSSHKTESKQPMQRIINIVTETGRLHQTNWGPMTKVVQSQEFQPTRKIIITESDFQGRKKLEEIAKKTEVYYPASTWNCQDWLENVLSTAVEEGLLSRQERESALEKARSTVSTNRYENPDWLYLNWFQVCLPTSGCCRQLRPHSCTGGNRKLDRYFPFNINTLVFDFL